MSHRPVFDLILALLLLAATVGSATASSAPAALTSTAEAVPDTAASDTASLANSPAPTSQAGLATPALPGGWTQSTPESQGIDSAALARMFDKISKERINLRSLVILRNGSLVTEAYFHPYTQNTPVQIQSVTKSVIGMLVGIAIQEGYLQSVDQRLLDFYPGRFIPNWDDRKGQITLKHLLTMTSGFDCQDFTPSGDGMYQVKGWVAYMFERPMASAPGTRFSYCGGNPHLLSAILQKVTGMSTREYANTRLFKPLGIAPVPESAWPSDPQKITFGSFGLYLAPRDLAKLGLLMLDQGKWGSKQVVPASWIAASTQQYITKEDGSGYGYLWTVYPEAGRYAALGLGEQQIHVVPGLNLVVIFTAGVANFEGTSPVVRLLKEEILPAVKSAAPLPSAPAAQARLAAAIRDAGTPRRAVPALPETARRISGKTFTLDNNPLNWTQFSLSFQTGAAVARVRMNDDNLIIGLDNLYRENRLPSGTELVRGRWASANTFVIDYPYPPSGQPVLGEIEQTEIRIAFLGDEVTITIQGVIFGGDPIIIKGTMVK